MYQRRENPMVGSGGKTVEADVEELDHGWPLTMACRATSLSQRHNLVAQKQRLNLPYVGFLSLLLLHSIASAEVSFEDRCDDRGECQSVASDLREDENIIARRVRWRDRKQEKAAPILIDLNCSFFSSSVGDQDFGRDTNRLEYFRVAALDVHGDNHLTGNASYGDGGGTTDHSVMVGPRLGQERVDAPTDADGSDMTTQVPVDDNGGDDSETLVQMLEQNSGSDGGEAVVQGLEHERDDGGGGVCDGEDGGDLVMVGWWEKWWVWLALWKIV